MKEVKVITLLDGVEVDSKQVEITDAMVGEFGTKIKAVIDIENKVEGIGGRPKNRPSPSA
jgi:hypothetical protein